MNDKIVAGYKAVREGEAEEEEDHASWEGLIKMVRGKG